MSAALSGAEVFVLELGTMGCSACVDAGGDAVVELGEVGIAVLALVEGMGTTVLCVGGTVLEGVVVA